MFVTLAAHCAKVKHTHLVQFHSDRVKRLQRPINKSHPSCAPSTRSPNASWEMAAAATAPGCDVANLFTFAG